MTDTQTAWLLAIAGGATVGGLYFATLWWTVQRAARAARPALILAGSFLFRGLLAAALLVALSGGAPWRLLAAIGAFLVVRTLVVQFVRAGVTAAPTQRPSPGEG